MTKRQLLIKVDDSDKERWKASADEWGVSLSEWIRRKCNAPEIEVAGEVFAGPVVTGRRGPRSRVDDATMAHDLATGTVRSENPVAVATRAGKKEKLGPEYFSICPHNLVKAGCPRCKGR
jgi:hypothetical protein